jgi:hypothetical protein
MFMLQFASYVVAAVGLRSAVVSHKVSFFFAYSRAAPLTLRRGVVNFLLLALFAPRAQKRRAAILDYRLLGCKI